MSSQNPNLGGGLTPDSQPNRLLVYGNAALATVCVLLAKRMVEVSVEIALDPLLAAQQIAVNILSGQSL